jgi:FMN phosphatase YigB (HAD superfamily)
MFSPNGIKAIFFDLDGTLRSSRPAGREFFMDYAAELGVPITPALRAHIWRWEHRYWAQSSELHADEKQFPEPADFWRNYSCRQLLAMGCTVEQAGMLGPIISLYMNENYHPENWLDPSTPNLLADLRTAGFTLGVLSNRDKPFDKELETLGIGEYFDYTIHAAEANAWKPNPAIFHYTFKKSNFSAHEMIYVGDNYFADVVGAKNAGVKPILLDAGNIFENPDCIKIRTLTELLLIA